MGRFKLNNIFTTFLLMLALIEVIIILVCFLNFVHFQADSFTKRLRNEISLHIELFSRELLDEISLSDFDAVAENLSLIRSKTGVDYISIDLGERSIESGKRHSPSFFSNEFLGLRLEHSQSIYGHVGNDEIRVHLEYGKIFEEEFLNPTIKLFLGILILFLIASTLCFLVFFRFIKKIILLPIENLANPDSQGQSRSKIFEIQNLSEKFSKLEMYREEAAIGNTVQMLAHDIRKPFSLFKAGLFL